MSKRVRKEDLTEDNARPAKVHKKAAPSVAPMEVDSDQTDVKQVAGHHGFALVKGPAAVINELKSAGAVTKLLRELNELIGEFCGGYSQPLLCTSLGDEPWSVAQTGENRLLVPVRGRGSEKLVELDVTTGTGIATDTHTLAYFVAQPLVLCVFRTKLGGVRASQRLARDGEVCLSQWSPFSVWLYRRRRRRRQRVRTRDRVQGCGGSAAD